MWYFVLFAFTLLFDQVSKIIFDANDFDIAVINGVFHLNNEYNDGAAFSFLKDVPWAQTFFIILTVVVLIAGFIFICVAKLNGKWLKTSIALLFSGTIGNFIDRIAFAHVRDFIDVKFFANFNIADCCLVIGSIMLVFYVLFLDKDPVFKVFKKNKAVADKESENNG